MKYTIRYKAFRHSVPLFCPGSLERSCVVMQIDSLVDVLCWEPAVTVP